MSNNNFEAPPERENDGVNPEHPVTELALLTNTENINNAPIANPNDANLLLEHDPNFSDVASETEEKEEVIVNDLGTGQQKS